MGINGKNSEFHAAMGLCNLKAIDYLIESRKKVTELYNTLLNLKKVQRPVLGADVSYNFSYYPIVFESESQLLKIKNELLKNNISARRYFYPSLNQLPYLENQAECPVSERIASRILCLPLYPELETKNVELICSLINNLL
jgi:dTDP-4-amino-4,6-dideoxygalactose transaminase